MVNVFLQLQERALYRSYKIPKTRKVHCRQKDLPPSFLYLGSIRYFTRLEKSDVSEYVDLGETEEVGSY